MSKIRGIEAASLFVGAFLFLGWATPASAEGATVGVEVEATIPPTTQASAPPPTTIAPATTVPATTAPSTSLAPTTTLAPATTVPEIATEPTPETEIPPLAGVVQEAVKEEVRTSALGQVKAAGRVAKEFFSQVGSGTPVAEVLQQMLPQDVANVVVPAVRTASTFAFPIGLAFAVLAFLVLQQRIDSTDPKLAAAPMAHEDDVVTFS